MSYAMPSRYATRPLKPTLLLVNTVPVTPLPLEEVLISLPSSCPQASQRPSLKLQAVIAKLNRVLG
jgi:hypothetical protein